MHGKAFFFKLDTRFSPPFKSLTRAIRVGHFLFSLRFSLRFFWENKRKPHNHAVIRFSFKRRNMRHEKHTTGIPQTHQTRINRGFVALCDTSFITTEIPQNYRKTLRFPYVFLGVALIQCLAHLLKACLVRVVQCHLRSLVPHHRLGELQVLLSHVCAEHMAEHVLVNVRHFF